jgi:hypothetical protein
MGQRDKYWAQHTKHEANSGGTRAVKSCRMTGDMSSQSTKEGGSGREKYLSKQREPYVQFTKGRAELNGGGNQLVRIVFTGSHRILIW